MLSANHSFKAIGTQWSIDTATLLSNACTENISRVVREFDSVYSRFRDDSLVSIAGRKAGVYKFPDSSIPILDTYDQLYALTDRAINPLVGRSLERLGYDSNYSLSSAGPMSAPELHETLTRDGVSLEFNAKVLLDIGAIGKGYLVDAIGAIVARDHDEYVIDGSGDIAVMTNSLQYIGLEDPRDANRIIGRVSMTSGSLCASATNRRSWGDGLHHILDTRSGSPVTTIIATWVIAPTTMIADALTTALFFTDPCRLMHEFGEFQYAILYADGSLQHELTENGELYI